MREPASISALDCGPSRSQRRVLLVDDNPGEARLIARLLQPSGTVHLDHASTLSSARERLLDQHYDAVLLDLFLPEDSRCDTLRQAARWAELVPIVALTNVHDPALARACLEAGVQGYIHKRDLKDCELLRSLDHAITRHRASKLQGRMGALERQVALGLIASGVVHEVNNQATVVLANLEQAGSSLEELRRYVSGHGQTMLDDLRQTVDENVALLAQISSIVAELRRFSRRDPAAGLETVDLTMLVERTLRLLHGRLSLRARVETELMPNVQVFDHGARLGQVLVNLLLNAFDAVEGGPPRSHRIGVAVHKRGSSAFLTVEDSGCGIPSHHLDQLFEPFFTSKPAERGTGLGLAISAEIVAALGGEISVESEPGRGSRFTVRLPLVSDARSTAPKLKSHRLNVPRVEQRARILLIDDQTPARRAIARLLSAHHDVVQAEGGAEGLSLLKQDTAFQVILCDLMMPGLDGSIVYDEATKIDLELAVRFLFLTGGTFTDTLRVFLEQARRPVVAKPVTRDTLLAAVRSVLGPPSMQ